MPNRKLQGEFNKHGLPRQIPNPIKREVRRRSGFGCVVCGATVYTYHHFDPPYADAKKHDPKGITLLCAECHSNATKGLLSDDTIRKKTKAPRCLEQGSSHFKLDIGGQFPIVHFGNSLLVGNPTIIRAFGKPLFAVDRPEKSGAPFRISALFYDREGRETCRIVENEWHGFIANWDIECTGNQFEVHRAHGEIAFRMRHVPPNELAVDRLDMFYRGFRVIIQPDGRTTTYLPDGQMWFQWDGASLIGNNAVIVIE
ncbi:MAG: HNH endonuclease [Planctomycetes bacterium]|nr:HNH endonuclease [Planctomycetota bacterium]